MVSHDDSTTTPGTMLKQSNTHTHIHTRTHTHNHTYQYINYNNLYKCFLNLRQSSVSTQTIVHLSYGLLLQDLL